MIAMHGDGALDHLATRQAYVLLASDFKTAAAGATSPWIDFSQDSSLPTALCWSSRLGSEAAATAGGRRGRGGRVPSERKKTLPGATPDRCLLGPLSRRPHARHSQSVRGPPGEPRRASTDGWHVGK